MVSPFHTYKLSVVYRDVGEVGGGYNSGGFPISYYIATQSLMYVFDFVCFIPSKYLTLMRFHPQVSDLVAIQKFKHCQTHLLWGTALRQVYISLHNVR